MAKPGIKRVYKCMFTEKPIRIDGFLNEPAWRKAGALEFILPVSHKKPISKTEGRVLWDRNCLYVGFKAYDKDVWGYFKKRDSWTFKEDALEVFFKTGVQEECYYNFEINALGTIYDAFSLKSGAGGKDLHRWSKWNCKGIKVGIHIEGTLNNPEDEDEYWQMEVAIPFKSLPTLKGKPPKSGDVWMFHLSRYDYSVYLPDGVELSSSAALKKVDFHRPKDWMKLAFKEES